MREIRRTGAGLGHLGFGGCRSRRERVVPTLLSVGVDEERWLHGIWVSKPQAVLAASTASSLLPSPPGLQLSPVWISSVSPSLPLAAYPLCLLVCTFSLSHTHFPASFFSTSPAFVHLSLCVPACFSLSFMLSFSGSHSLPRPAPSEVPGPTHLGVVPTSVTPASRAIFTPG